MRCLGEKRRARENNEREEEFESEGPTGGSTLTAEAEAREVLDLPFLLTEIQHIQTHINFKLQHKAGQTASDL